MKMRHKRFGADTRKRCDYVRLAPEERQGHSCHARA